MPSAPSTTWRRLNLLAAIAGISIEGSSEPARQVTGEVFRQLASVTASHDDRAASPGIRPQELALLGAATRQRTVAIGIAAVE